jgi:hypothetical protein
LFYRWTNCIKDFDLPVKFFAATNIWLKPTTSWQTQKLAAAVDAKDCKIDRNFYVNAKNVTGVQQ